MKGQRLLFGVCLGVLAFWNASATDYDDAVRAAVRGIGNMGATSRNAPNAPKTTTQSTSRTNTTVAPRATTTNESRTMSKGVVSRTQAILQCKI